MNRSIAVAGFMALTLVGSRVAAQDSKKEEPKFKLSLDEQKLLDQVNKEREKEKLPPLKADPKLCKAARAHSANMAKQEMLEHILDGKKPGQRIEEAGYSYLSSGENIYRSDALDPARVVAGWMTSKVHRETILSKKFTETGLGIARSTKGEYYYTQVFALPEKKVSEVP